MKHLFSSVLMLIWLLFSVSSSVQAQQASSTLTGVVSDQQGAVIPNATVTATNKATNLSRTVLTNGEGVYVISSLPVGEYELEIKATGFATSTRILLILSVGQTVNLDVNLIEVGEIIDRTVYQVNEPLVDTQTSKVDAVIKNKEIENLPLNGRNFLELALLVPGNAPAPNFDPTKTNTVVDFFRRTAWARRQCDD